MTEPLWRSPTEEKSRAFVEVVDVMTFPDGTPRVSKFIEGYLSKSDGTVGDRFYEIQGKVTVFKKLTDDDWSYHAVPEQGEL